MIFACLLFESDHPKTVYFRNGKKTRESAPGKMKAQLAAGPGTSCFETCLYRPGAVDGTVCGIAHTLWRRILCRKNRDPISKGIQDTLLSI